MTDGAAAASASFSGNNINRLYEAPSKEGIFTAWRYCDLNATAKAIIEPGFFANWNKQRVNLRKFDTIDVECRDGWFKARVYDLEVGTNAPYLMLISQILKVPKSAAGTSGQSDVKQGKAA